MPRYFINPFATAGTYVEIPDDAQPSGSVSYAAGWTVNYTYNINTNPAALAVSRSAMNGVLYDITSNVQYWQQNGAPAFVTSSDNGGSPYPYNKGAIVLFTNGNYYQSLIDSNTDTPPSDQWQLINFVISGTATGTANAITLNPAAAINLNIVNTVVLLTPTAANTTATTFKLGTAAALPVRVNSKSGGLTACSGGEFQTGAIAILVCDGTFWQLTNPAETIITPTTFVTPAALQQQIYTYGVDSGSLNSLVYNNISPAYANIPGCKIQGSVSNTNTGAATLNVGGLGAYAVKVQIYGGYRDPLPGELSSLDSSYEFQGLISGGTPFWQLINPNPLPVGRPTIISFGTTSTQTIPITSSVTIQFDRVVYDSLSIWNPATYEFELPIAGWWNVNMLVNSYGTSATQYLTLWNDTPAKIAVINGTPVAISDTLQLSFSCTVQCNSIGQAFHLEWTNSSTLLPTTLGWDGSGSTTGTQSNSFTITYLGSN